MSMKEEFAGSICIWKRFQMFLFLQNEKAAQDAAPALIRFNFNPSFSDDARIRRDFF